MKYSLILFSILLFSSCGEESKEYQLDNNPESMNVSIPEVSINEAASPIIPTPVDPDFSPCRLIQKTRDWYLIACPANINVPVNGRYTRSWNTHMVYKEDIL